jgi:hypothetical protein
MRVAVVTLVIGHTYLDRWKFQCEPGWRAYCQRHGYDLVVIDHALDTSARAQSRSPAWQKCLILDGLTQYDRVVWIDADIVINPHSPPIPEIPIEKIGAVDESASLSYWSTIGSVTRTSVLATGSRISAHFLILPTGMPFAACRDAVNTSCRPACLCFRLGTIANCLNTFITLTRIAKKRPMKCGPCHLRYRRTGCSTGSTIVSMRWFIFSLG